MNHRRFRDDLRYMGVLLKELSYITESLPEDIGYPIAENVMLLTNKLDDMVNNVYLDKGVDKDKKM